MRSKGIWVLFAFFVLVGTSLWLKFASKPSSAPIALNSAPTGDQPATETQHSPSNISANPVLSAARMLERAQTPDERAQVLVTLRDTLSVGKTNEMVAAIQSVLDAKMDASTGQGFKIGGGGVLLEAPTLRTWLLEELARLDPVAAAACAREILSDSDSPDEWALALRNLARGDTSADAHALLEAKTVELLRNASWQQDPSVGYLEAFDTAVHIGGTTLLSPLTVLVSKKGNQAVAHAAYLTLDRLVINEPAAVLAALNEHPNWMQGREETRANYFARADIGDPEQRRLVETYLLAEDRSPAELNTFAGVFPNANFMISHNLLTENPTPDGATLRQRDLAALRVMEQWAADPRFKKTQQPLLQVQQRLLEFTKASAENAGDQTTR